MAISLAGVRYTPKLNVQVSIASVFDGLGRTRKFYEELKSPANEIIKALKSIKDEEVIKVAPREFARAKSNSLNVASLLLKTPNSGVKQIPFSRIYAVGIKAQENVHKCIRLLQEAQENDRKTKEESLRVEKESTERLPLTHEDKFRDEIHHLYRIGNALRSSAEFAKSDKALAANNPRIILTGIAGSGKTHFLCDLAKHRVMHDLPSFIFLGEEFCSKDPWDTVRGLLDITASKDTFLEALNRYAANKRTRALIIVDALNESQMSGIHWEWFNQTRRYSHLGIILSVRSGFEQSEIPVSVQATYVKVQHEGFASHEWEALTKFFAEYKLPLPEIPILFPEFSIPLFLKIFCESFAGSKEPIKGHYGFTHIFEQYVKKQGIAVLKKLGETADLGQSRKRVWNGIIKALALYMGENGTDRVPERHAISIVAKEFPSRGKSTLGVLERVWLITKVPQYRKYKPVGFEYKFPYQKFSDHLIVRNLLTKHLVPSSPHDSFKKGTRLHEILKEEWSNRGLIEALSIQVPERLRGKELVYVAPRRFRDHQVARESFLESLIWRDLALENGKPKYIRRKAVLNFVNRYILPYSGDDKVLETLITVSAIPHHPLNALLLHNHLSKYTMPKRDTFWLPFVNARYGDKGAINRLLAWAWDGGDKGKIQDESLRLAGITLGWFLASSNRFLRDRSTKALVSMFTGRIPVLIKVLEDFNGVKDPYIQERLCAVAYGCCLQPDNTTEHVSALALYVYDNIFKNNNPPAHILTRDYARGVVEVAIIKDISLKGKIDILKVRPPYGSAFPSRIPSLNFLRRKYYPKLTSYKEESYGTIWNSLMHNNEGGIADFGNYVVNSTLSHWCKLRLPRHGSRPKTIKELDAEFNSTLSSGQKRKWKKLEGVKRSLMMKRFFSSLPKNDTDGKTEKSLIDERVESERRHNYSEKAFIETLSKNLQRLYRTGVLPYRANPGGQEHLNVAEIQRLIFSRIIELGWEPKLFSKYDSTVSDMSRAARKSERIGKKYQWIAFHETLGRIADNFVFTGNWREDFRPYEGPWRLSGRDIDPSCLLRACPKDPTTKPWWVGTLYNKWCPSLTHTHWIRITSDLPDQKKLIVVRARGGWVILDGNVRWEQPPVPGEGRFDKVTRDIWYLVRSYIVKRKEASRMYSWARKQNFMGRWMPDPPELRNIFLREFPFSRAYRSEYDVSNKKRWITIEDKQRKVTGFKVMQPTEEYAWSEGGFDCSVDNSIRINFPSKDLVKAMGLMHSREPGKFTGERGETVAMDPSVAEPGPGVFLVKRTALQDFLRKSNSEIIWAIIGEKLLIGGNNQRFLGRLEMGGAFKMRADGKLKGKTYTHILPPRND